MESWIYIIIFIIVPIINRIIEMKKAGAEKAAAEAKRLMRKEARKSRKKSSAPRIEAAADPVPLKEDGWNTVDDPVPVTPDPQPFESAEINVESEEPGMWTPGGWVPISDSGMDVSGREASPGLEIFSFPLPEDEAGEEAPDLSESNEVFQLEPQAPTAAYDLKDLPSAPGSATTPRRNHKNLTRDELRDRLIWREILGPPLSMREQEF